MSRLRRPNHLCSSTVSDTANMSRHGSTLCSPTEEKILCRSPFRSGHISAICARLSQKEVGVKRVETLVSTLLPRRGARRRSRRPQTANPLAEVQRKTPRPLGANTPTAVRVPRSAGAEKGCHPEGANPLTQFAHPAQPVQKRSRPERVNRLRGSGPPFTLCRETKKTPFIKRLYNI